MDKKTVERIGNILLVSLRKELAKQGHRLTGNLERSIKYRVLSSGVDTLSYIYTMRGYGGIMDTGIPASRIPYTPNSGAKRSKYIAGLQAYAVQRMRVTRAEALGIAFAIARKHKEEGMFTRASVRFSSTGTRYNYLQTAVDNALPLIREVLERFIFEQINSITVKK